MGAGPSEAVESLPHSLSAVPFAAVSPSRRDRVGIAAIGLLAVAYVLPFSGLGWNQGAHYAQIEALSHGTGRVDAYRWQSGDLALYHGHYYSTKAPGVAFLGEPFYLLFRATGLLGLVSRHTPSAWAAAQVVIWALAVCVVVVASVALLLTVRSVAERVAPGYGTATSLTLGLGTLVLPFSTVLFSHVPSGAFAFGAFALVARFGDASPSRRRLALAGVLAGFGVCVEYTLAIVCAVLALYVVAAAGDRLQRLGAYLAGAALGVSPLLIYDRLVYGSFTHVSYANAIGASGGRRFVGENARGLFGVSVPHLTTAFSLLFDSRGLLVTAPVLALGVVGLVLMARSGLRAEALACGGILLAFLVLNAGYFLPFGGAAPGPRLLVPALPFFAPPLALAYRRFPAATLMLALASALVLLCATATKPMLGSGDTSVWATDLGKGAMRETVLAAAGVRGLAGAAPFLLAALAACAVLVLAVPQVPLPPRALVLPAVALALWIGVAAAADNAAGAGWRAVALAAGAAILAACAPLALAPARSRLHRAPAATLSA